MVTWAEAMAVGQRSGMLLQHLGCSTSVPGGWHLGRKSRASQFWATLFPQTEVGPDLCEQKVSDPRPHSAHLQSRSSMVYLLETSQGIFMSVRGHPFDLWSSGDVLLATPLAWLVREAAELSGVWGVADTSSYI